MVGIFAEDKVDALGRVHFRRVVVASGIVSVAIFSDRTQSIEIVCHIVGIGVSEALDAHHE